MKYAIMGQTHHRLDDKKVGPLLIEIRQSAISNGEFNRGVFATEAIRKGTMFHSAPVISYLNEEHEHIGKTILDDYAFNFGANHSAIVLGYGSLFNHSYTPNAYYELNFEQEAVDFFAYTDIAPGDEIFINYNGEVDCNDELWFTKAD